MKVEVTIAQISGPDHPPPIAVTFKHGAKTLIRVEMTASDFALAITGRLVFGETTRGIIPSELSSAYRKDER